MATTTEMTWLTATTLTIISPDMTVSLLQNKWFLMQVCPERKHACRHMIRKYKIFVPLISYLRNINLNLNGEIKYGSDLYWEKDSRNGDKKI